jgi:hypothetical protein
MFRLYVSCKHSIGIRLAFLSVLYEQHPYSLLLFTKIQSRYDTTNACLCTTTIIPLFNKTITICPSAMHLISPPTAGIVIVVVRLKCPYRRFPLNHAITIHLTSSFQQSYRMRRFRDNRPFCVSSHVDGRLSLVNCLRCPLSPVSRHFSFPIVLAINTYNFSLLYYDNVTVLIAEGTSSCLVAHKTWVCECRLALQGFTPPFSTNITSVHSSYYPTTHRHHASHPNNCVVSLSAIINQNATCPSEARLTYRMTL